MKLKEVTATPKVMEKLNRWKRDIQSLTTESYRPYLTVKAVNQYGRRHWIFCNVQKRHAHLLSDGELRMYKKLIWARGTKRVFEQYALDLNETLNIAVAGNLIHPRNWETSEAYVMTTDFLVQHQDLENPSRIITTAYSFKYASQIYVVDEEGVELEGSIQGEERKLLQRKNARTWQKFAIEREYWRRRGIKYQIVTELDATKEEFNNIRFCEPAGFMKFEDELVRTFVFTFCHVWQRYFMKPLEFLLLLTSQQLNCSDEQVIRLFQFSVLKHFLPLKHSSTLQFHRPVELTL
jgi:hypothetical protein